MGAICHPERPVRGHGLCAECYYKANKTRIIAKVKEWTINNRDRHRETRRKHDHKLRADVFRLLGGVCQYCRFSDSRALQVDHVEGGGMKELKALGHTRAIYQKVLLSDGVGYQLLCANCNVIKHRSVAYGEVNNQAAQCVAG